MILFPLGKESLLEQAVPSSPPFKRFTSRSHRVESYSSFLLRIPAESSVSSAATLQKIVLTLDIFKAHVYGILYLQGKLMPYNTSWDFTGKRINHVRATPLFRAERLCLLVLQRIVSNIWIGGSGNYTYICALMERT